MFLNLDPLTNIRHLQIKGKTQENIYWTKILKEMELVHAHSRQVLFSFSFFHFGPIQSEMIRNSPNLVRFYPNKKRTKKDLLPKDLWEKKGGRRRRKICYQMIYEERRKKEEEEDDDDVEMWWMKLNCWLLPSKLSALEL